MTAPSEEQVRAAREEFVRRGLATLAEEQPGLYTGLVAEALALLDAGRKDRERVDKLERMAREYDVRIEEWEGLFCVGELTDEVRPVGEGLRAAIDRARGA